MIKSVFYKEDGFEQKYTYKGEDLGAVWTRDSTVFRVWAPKAEEVVVNLYTSGTAGREEPMRVVGMTEDRKGTWAAKVQGDLNGIYYTYTIKRGGRTTKDVCDPYARTTGVNGRRAMVIDLDSTDPEGWSDDSNPHKGKRITDAVIYEGHIRDLTVDKESGVSEQYRGKFLGLTETGTTTSGGMATVVDHMKELGITHLHLLPIYDFGSVEEDGEGEIYNWGYDPVNYNVPEGSYSTDPYHGAVRVKELKQMVQALHRNGIGVIMDVVYNHVYHADDFCVNRLVPGYFSRIRKDGTLSNDSECDNDTASERSMVRKYIVDSVCYWADEYHMDGFRFDLVGLLDMDTVNELTEKVHQKHPDVIFYGEGWDMATEAAEGYTMATQANSAQTPDFAYFNDSIRDVLKGSVFKPTSAGYVSGKAGEEDKVIKNFLGRADWCGSPSQTVNYVSCHDNHTLFDRLRLTVPEAAKEDWIRMNKLAAAVYILAQGIPFMQAGEEFLRSKEKPDHSFSDNSYNAGDVVNAIRWGDLEKADHAEVFAYYKGLIAIRKAHDIFRLSSAAEVEQRISAAEGLEPNVVALDMEGKWFVIFNANPAATRVALPDGTWAVLVNGEKADKEAAKTITGTAAVEPVSAVVLMRVDSVSLGEGKQN